MQANHRGKFQFRICNADGMENDPEMSCFDDNVLLSESGADWRNTINEFDSRSKTQYDWGTQNNLVYNVVLPQNMTCENCILQV